MTELAGGPILLNQMVRSPSTVSMRGRHLLTAGILYEMGGTWVTHHMAYLFTEMIRYEMDRDLLITHHREYENDYYTLNVPGNV